MTDKSAFPFDGGQDQKRHAPATARNVDAIVEVLSSVLPETGLALELASGTGEHIIHFAQAFPNIKWQPSDLEADAIASIAAWTREVGAPNILPPVSINAVSNDWPIARADAVLCINMLHISPWEAAVGLMQGASAILPLGALLYLYGPYFEAEVSAAESNLSFDQSLKQRNSDWGIRQLADVRALAEENELKFERRVEMPANNLSVIFRKI